MPPAHSSVPAVVIAEDDPTMAAIIQRLLEMVAPDYEPIIVTRPCDALAQLAQRKAPLLIADYQLPDFNGLQLTRLVKQRFRHTTVILISIYDASDLGPALRESGADVFLVKPFPLEVMEAAVRKALTPRS